MGESTGIAWTDHTFNPWWGCTKISDECTHCYAERDAGRWGFDCFGPGKPRRFFGDAHWNEPLKWDRKAERDGERRRVFCASMGDVFDREVPDLVRARLWALIAKTPHLDWLVLTKRPEYMRDMLPPDHMQKPWPNLWLGFTAGTQAAWDHRWPIAREIPAVVRFVSVEPALECVRFGDVLMRRPERLFATDLHWVILGEESGPGARRCGKEALASMLCQAKLAGIPVFIKQAWEGDKLVKMPKLYGVTWAGFPGAESSGPPTRECDRPSTHAGDCTGGQR